MLHNKYIRSSLEVSYLRGKAPQKINLRSSKVFKLTLCSLAILNHCANKHTPDHKYRIALDVTEKKSQCGPCSQSVGCEAHRDEPGRTHTPLPRWTECYLDDTSSCLEHPGKYRAHGACCSYMIQAPTGEMLATAESGQRTERNSLYFFALFVFSRLACQSKIFPK